MINMVVKPDVNGKWVVQEADGGNGRVILSSTSQGYDRLARAEEMARRVAPRGDEVVNLVIKDADGKVKRREVLHDPGAAAQ